MLTEQQWNIIRGIVMASQLDKDDMFKLLDAITQTENYLEEDENYNPEEDYEYWHEEFDGDEDWDEEE